MANDNICVFCGGKLEFYDPEVLKADPQMAQLIKTDKAE